MQKSVIIFIVVLFSGFVLSYNSLAQSSQKMSFQAVIRKTDNSLVTSNFVGTRISILQGSSTGTEVYKETYSPNPKTNANGLLTIEVGGGTPVSGAFEDIDWTAGPYYIKTEIDPEGGTDFTITGTSQLLFVPYSFYSKATGNYSESDPVYAAWNKTTGISIESSQVNDFQSAVTNNAAVLANTAKVSNSTHTGDAAGSLVLTVTGINGTRLADMPTGLLKNTTTTGIPAIAVPGTDYLTPTGSAALLTGFPVLNQNTTGTASNITGIIAINNGGTGASDASTARTNLGLGSLATLNSVTTSEIADGTITTTDIANATITGQDLAAGSVSTTQILDGTISGADIGSDAITASNLAASSVTTSKIADGTITTTDIANNTITAQDLAAGSVSTTQILDGTISAADIGPDAITASNLAAGSVTTSEIADGTITTTDISSIDASKISGISGNSIPKSHYMGSYLVSSQIKDDGTNVWVGSTTYINSKFSAVGSSSSVNTGICGSGNLSTNAENIGVLGLSYNATSANYGIKGRGVGTVAGSTNYGVFGEASGASTNWAGYFGDGNIHFANQIQAPNLSSASGTSLVVDASGWITKFSSDASLKENITPLDNSLEKVLQLQGVNFTWKSDSEHQQDIGLIAQDVQKVFPELVIQDRNNGLLSVKYQNMVAILIEAMKTQQKEIEFYKSQLKLLQERMDQIETLMLKAE